MKLQAGCWDTVPNLLNTLMTYFPLTSYEKLKSCYERPIGCRESCYILLTSVEFFDPFATFVLVDSEFGNMILFESLNSDWAEFSAAIAECQLIKWSSAVIGPVPSRLAPMFEDLCEKVGRKCRDRCQHCEEFYAYHINRDTALSLKVLVLDDTDIALCTLREWDADLINQLWPYGGTDESLKMLRYTLKRPTSVGLMSKETGELRAFCVHFDYGAPGALHVMEKFKRKGYGKTVLTAISQNMAKSGCEPKAFIALNNFPSQKLFEKVGYRRLGIERWHYFL